MSGQIAHLNWAYLLYPFDDPRVSGFTDNLDRVNAIAARSPGFVRNCGVNEAVLHKVIFAPRGDFDPAREAATLSVWEDVTAFRHFVQNTLHGKFMARRGEWFVPLGRPAHVVWPIETGHIPALSEAHDALSRLEANGPSADAFDLSWDGGEGKTG